MQTTQLSIDPGAAARLATGLAVSVLVAGLAGVLAYSIAEATRTRATRSPTGYWRGRLPWMAVIEVLVVAGAASSVLVGAATVMAFGGWLRRLLVVQPVALAGMWWFLAWAGLA